jgi:energy-coupling factor transport system ATP-binding protein
VKKPVVQFEGFSFRYRSQKNPTLADINLEIAEGEKVLILGASGSGKSTLANCVNGLIPFSYPGVMGGSCRVNGRDTRDLSVFALSREVGTVLQDADAQFVGLSVGEDIAFSMENDRVEPGLMRERVRENSRRVGMEAFLGMLPFHLSGGQKQKTALAGVLGSRTNILIFDEPLASLDPQMGTLAIDLIDRICRENHCAVIIIEHRLEDVLYRPVDRIILMDKGRIAADTEPRALLGGNLLRTYGIREPLYITALKYAGCALEEVDEPERPGAFMPREAAREKLLAFFRREAAPPPPEPGEELIRVEGVSYAYPEGRAGEALRDVSFTLRRGERIALIGKNGAGKSTMAKLICGIIRPARGAILIGGEDYRRLTVKEISGTVGYVMQDPNQMLVKDSIREEVELALRLRGFPPETVEEKSRGALETCELYRFRNWPTGAVSYGQKKRVTIASVLALEPELIILDEPSAGQDYRHYTEIIGFINRLNANHGKTIIFITHDMHLAIENTDRAIVFADGRCIAQGNIFSILSDPVLVERASLKQSSLHHLARKLGLPPEDLISRYIQHERTVRAGEDPAP